MNFSEQPKERNAEQLGIPEYNFEDGANEAYSRIKELLSGDQNIIVVAFSGSSAHVGKTTLARELLAKIRADGSNAVTLKGAEENDLEGINFQQYLNQLDQKKLVLIFEQLVWDSVPSDEIEKSRKLKDENLKSNLGTAGISIEGINLWIGIDSPNRPFSKMMTNGKHAKPIADIIIHNEHAKDKVL